MTASHHTSSAPALLRGALGRGEIMTFIGVYDVFSATVAARHFDGLFVSGYGFAASFYGLPDIGLIAWSDIVSFVQRLRVVLPTTHVLVDIDDGYGDVETACHVVSLLEAAGASGVILEDQARPRRCGHLDGKRILPLEAYLDKLNRVLETRSSLFVVARTDVDDQQEIERRVRAFADVGADAVLADGLKDLRMLDGIRKAAGVPVMFNQLYGGKSEPCSLSRLASLGVSLVNYSTPCLFAAHTAMDSTLKELRQRDGVLEGLSIPQSGLIACNVVLEENLRQRDKRTGREPVPHLVTG